MSQQTNESLLRKNQGSFTVTQLKELKETVTKSLIEFGYTPEVIKEHICWLDDIIIERLTDFDIGVFFSDYEQRCPYYIKSKKESCNAYFL